MNEHMPVEPVRGQLGLDLGERCHLCRRPVNHWADLCDHCAAEVAELADRIGEPRDLR